MKRICARKNEVEWDRMFKCHATVILEPPHMKV